MAIERYLAMTAAEIGNCSALPAKIGWMACHFSPYGTGLSNLPGALPAGSMLILNDRTPIHGHDPRKIITQLAEVMEKQECACLLLDFQRAGVEETAVLARQITKELSFPTGVSEWYAKDLSCPVFLPPVPTDIYVKDHLAPWAGREIWLEAALVGQTITLTAEGARTAPLPHRDAPGCGFINEKLHCRYTIRVLEDHAEFHLTRSMEDLDTLLAEAEALGVTRGVGLWQELGVKMGT